jgi:vancomycin resistance protein YoaR
VVSSYLFTSGPIALPTMALTPVVSDEEAAKVRDNFAAPAVSAPLPVTFNGGTDTLGVDTIVEGLSFAPEGSTLQAQLNVATIRGGLPSLAAVEKPGTDATWNVSSGTPVVVPSKQGQGVPDDQLTTEVLRALPLTGADRKAQLTIVATDPELTTAEAQALNIHEQLSSFTQKFDYAEYRRVNVGQAAKYMDGKVLKPGDVYSMNDTIKERTEANGYVEGTFISNGRFEQGLGGGVSIATTATWTAAFFAGLEAVEVNPHSLYISRYQAGLEATVAWGQLDLKFKNDTGNGVLITTEAGDTFITVTMWGTKVYDNIHDESSDRYNVEPYETVQDSSAECNPQGGVNGFTIDVWRVFGNGGKEVKREKFTTDYDPTTHVVCVPKSTPKTTPSPSG